MTDNKLKQFFNNCSDSAYISYVRENNKDSENEQEKECGITECDNDTCVVINWSLKGTGFGELTMYKKDGKWLIDTETMGKKAAKKILALLVDSMELYD